MSGGRPAAFENATTSRILLRQRSGVGDRGLAAKLPLVKLLQMRVRHAKDNTAGNEAIAARPTGIE